MSLRFLLPSPRLTDCIRGFWAMMSNVLDKVRNGIAVRGGMKEFLNIGWTEVRKRGDEACCADHYPITSLQPRRTTNRK